MAYKNFTDSTTQITVPIITCNICGGTNITQIGNIRLCNNCATAEIENTGISAQGTATNTLSIVIANSGATNNNEKV